MNKFEEIATRLRPRRVKEIDYSKPPDGNLARFNPDGGILQAPPPIDEKSLWNFLHEYAHANFHWDRRIWDSVPRHVKEYECERWTKDRFEEEGILSGKLMEDSRFYVRKEIEQNFDVLHEKGLDKRAIEYLLPAESTQLLALYDNYFLEQSNGLITGSKARFDYMGPTTSEEMLEKSRPDF
jgi:hypothetical protein